MSPLKSLVVAVLLSVAPIFAQQTPPDDLYPQINSLERFVTAGTATRDQRLRLAQLYIQAGRFYEASKLAEGVVAMRPDDSEAVKVRDEANNKLTESLKRNVAEAEARAQSNNPNDRIALGNAYFEAGRYGAAADVYGGFPPTALDRDTRIRYARALAWSSRLDDAERVYSSLLADQADPALRLEYGRLLSWMGASRASLDSLTDVYNATHTEQAAIALANAKAWSGDREGAIVLLDTFTSTNPNALQAQQLSRDLKSSPELGIERVNKLITVDPYNLALLAEKARLQSAAGHYSEALKTIAFIREHSRGQIEGLDELQKTTEARRSSELATLADRLHLLESQQSASMASAASADEVLSLAKGYTALEDYDHATRLYDRYLSVRPDDTDARIQYARVLSWDRRWRASEAQYRTLLDRHPDRADLRFEYGQVLSYDSDYRNALPVLQAVTDLSGNPRANLYSDVPPRAYYHIGQIYRWFGWNEHDVAAQNQAIALDGGYTPAREELDLVRHLRPRSTIEGRYTYSTDSDDFTMHRYDLSAEKWVSPRTAYNLGVGRHDFDFRGDTVSANVISGGGKYRFSDRLLARGNVGVNLYDHGAGTRPFFGIGAEWLPSLQSRAALDFNHYDLIYDVFTLQSLTVPNAAPALNFNSPIGINDVRGHYDYNGGGFWSMLADASYGFISDSNHRAAAHGVAAFRVWKQPFIALKGDVHYLGYDFRSNRYWSPPSYHSLAGVVQVGQNVRDRFFWSFEVKAGKAYESGFTSDIRAYEGTVTVPVSDAFDIVGDYGYGKSGRINSIVAFNGSSNDFVNYWQRHWYVGVRLKQLFGRGERGPNNPYYYDNRALSGSQSPVIPPLGETH